jgi:hypothetical protein
MTPETMRAIYPLVTVHSPSQEVNLMAAPAGVVRALPGMDAARAQVLLSIRASGPPLTHPAVVRVTAEARTAGGGIFIREAVLRRTAVPTRPFDVLSWRRRWPQDVAAAAP